MTSKSLVLPGILDLKAAGPLAENLLSARGSDLSVDASGVERLGAQCLQILVSAVATWHADGASIDVAEPSAAFVEGLAALGMTPGDLLGGAHAGGQSGSSAA